MNKKANDPQAVLMGSNAGTIGAKILLFGIKKPTKNSGLRMRERTYDTPQ